MKAITKIKRMHTDNTGFIMQNTLDNAFAELVYHIEMYSYFSVSIQKKEKAI